MTSTNYCRFSDLLYNITIHISAEPPLPYLWTLYMWTLYICMVLNATPLHFWVRFRRVDLYFITEYVCVYSSSCMHICFIFYNILCLILFVAFTVFYSFPRILNVVVLLIYSISNLYTFIIINVHG